MKHVVITGTSTGLGYGAAEALIAAGFHVFGSVRSGDDGARVGAALGAAFTPLVFDVTDGAAIDSAVDDVRRQVGSDGLFGLVNNAGIAVAGPLEHIALDDVRHQLDVNVLGPLRITQAFLPLLGGGQAPRKTPARILMMSSVAGRIAMPFVGPYTASKHALEALSDSLRRELALYGIDVILIEPGIIKTPIWDKPRDFSTYQRTAYGPMIDRELERIAVEIEAHGLDVDAVNRAIVHAMTSARPKVRYVITGTPFLKALLPKRFPDRWLDWLVARRTGVSEARERLRHTPRGDG